MCPRPKGIDQKRMVSRLSIYNEHLVTICEHVCMLLHVLVRGPTGKTGWGLTPRHQTRVDRTLEQYRIPSPNWTLHWKKKKKSKI